TRARKVHARKLAVMKTSEIVVRTRGGLFARQSADRDLLAVHRDRRSPAEADTCPGDTLVPAATRLLLGVSSVGRWRAETQVAALVVQTIAIPMVDKEIWRGPKNQSVHLQTSGSHGVLAVEVPAVCGHQGDVSFIDQRHGAAGERDTGSHPSALPLHVIRNVVSHQVVRIVRGL